MTPNHVNTFLLVDPCNVYRKFDLNGSGYISADELRGVLSKMHRHQSREEIDDLIRSVDRNRDGMLSINEFADLLFAGASTRSGGRRSALSVRILSLKENFKKLNTLISIFLSKKKKEFD